LINPTFSDLIRAQATPSVNFWRWTTNPCHSRCTYGELNIGTAQTHERFGPYRNDLNPWHKRIKPRNELNPGTN